jgi:hypothetical protein
LLLGHFHCWESEQRKPPRIRSKTSERPTKPPKIQGITVGTQFESFQNWPSTVKQTVLRDLWEDDHGNNKLIPEAEIAFFWCKRWCPHLWVSSHRPAKWASQALSQIWQRPLPLDFSGCDHIGRRSNNV